MQESKYYLQDEIKVAQSPDGLKQASLSKKFIGSDETIKDQFKPVEDFEKSMEKHLFDFEELIKGQRSEIKEDVDHREFFLKEKFKHHQWGANREFDQLRLLYISQIESLKKELRGLDRDFIAKKINMQEKLLDSKKELSPLRNLF